ncbi:MAG: EamA family transporter RarD, partial [Anaerolineales bacterium]
MQKQGFLYALGAYTIWGMFPVYWKSLHQVPALELIGHRIFWSFLTLLGMLAFSGQVGVFWRHLTQVRTRRFYLIAALLIGLNWLIYVWGVNSNHIVETSLGYFINPLLSVLLGVVILRERLRPFQWLPVGMAAAGVLYLTVIYGRIPWIALMLACTFALYGLVKKMAPLNSLHGLSLETALLFPLAFLYLLYREMDGQGAFLRSDMVTTLMLLGAGLIGSMGGGGGAPAPAVDTSLDGKTVAVTAVSSDTGLSASDFNTSDQTLTITGTSDAADGTQVAVKIDGATVGTTTVMAGVWSYNHTGITLAEGGHTLDAELVNGSGNVAATAADRALTVDIQADEAAIAGKVIAVTAISDDTGVAGNDFITNDQTLTISGTSDATNGANVAVKIDGSVIGYTTVTGGVWSYNHTGTTLAAGSYTLDADLVDAAGNIAATSVDRALVVDMVGDEAAIA